MKLEDLKHREMVEAEEKPKDDRPRFVTSFSNRGIVVVDREKGRGTAYKFRDSTFERAVAKYPPYVHQEIKAIRTKYKDSAWYKEEMKPSMG